MGIDFSIFHDNFKIDIYYYSCYDVSNDVIEFQSSSLMLRYLGHHNLAIVAAVTLAMSHPAICCHHPHRTCVQTVIIVSFLSTNTHYNQVQMNPDTNCLPYENMDLLTCSDLARSSEVLMHHKMMKTSATDLFVYFAFDLAQYWDQSAAGCDYYWVMINVWVLALVFTNITLFIRHWTKW